MSSAKTIQFLLGFDLRELSDFSPTLTVLEYLRREERMTGTKEGCAEGDCGACTAVITEVKDGKLHYQAVNTCIMFVPFLHGRQLITVEHLKAATNTLHPVQQALVDQHGSQCGFCTPGFVMTIFAMFHKKRDLRRSAIDDDLAGNLCRCTGYAPIVRAVHQALAVETKDQFHCAEQSTVRSLSKLNSTQAIHFKTNDQSYYAPTKVKELESILAQQPDCHIVAGATDVGLWITKQRRHLLHIVQIDRINELKRLEIKNGEIRIGAVVPIGQAMITLSQHYPAADELFRRFGSVQIRNLATIGGNIANGSPIGDSLPMLVALNAKLLISSAAGTRQLSIEDFFIEYGKQNLKLGEFVKRVDIPLPASNQIFKIYKISKRFHQDISSVCGAFSLLMVSNTIQSVRVCFGGMAATPRRAYRCEDALIGCELTDEVVACAQKALNKDFSPITDFRGSLEYRRLVAGNLLQRLANDLNNDTNTSIWSRSCA